MAKRFRLLAAAALLTAACTQPGEPPDRSSTAAGRAGPDAALADTLTGLIEAAYDFSRPDVVQRMGSLYPDTGRAISASAGRLTASADSLRAGLATFWEDAGRNMRDARWQWDEVEVDRLGLDAAVLTATWSIPHIAPGGQEHVIRGAWTAVFRRIGAEWKVIHEHLSAPA